MAAATGRPVSPDRIEPVRLASCGLPAIVAALAAAPTGPAGSGSAGSAAVGSGAMGSAAAPSGAATPALVARVQRQLTGLDAPTAELARVVALRLDLPDRVLAVVAGFDPTALGAAMRTLHDRGVLGPPGERMIPAVAQAIVTDLPPADRRRLHERVAGALVDLGGDPVAAARQLTAARARNAAAAQIYRRAADQVRLRDPAGAMSWYDDALDAGAEPATVAAGRSEAAALLGQPIDVDITVSSTQDTARIRMAAGAVSGVRGPG